MQKLSNRPSFESIICYRNQLWREIQKAQNGQGTETLEKKYPYESRFWFFPIFVLPSAELEMKRPPPSWALEACIYWHNAI